MDLRVAGRDGVACGGALAVQPRMEAPLNDGYTSMGGGNDGEYDSLWEGDGNNLQMDDNELRISWNSGFFTRSRNVISLSLDQINYIKMVQRSKPVVLLLALIVGIAIPLYVNEVFEAENCTWANCWLSSHESDLTGVSAAFCIVLIIGYACTLKTTLVFGTASTSFFGVGEIYVHLLGREATENAEMIIRKVHHARSEFLKKGQ